MLELDKEGIYTETENYVAILIVGQIVWKIQSAKIGGERAIKESNLKASDKND